MTVRSTRGSSDPRTLPLERDGVRLRDYTLADLPRVADLLDPARPWHATNGPYFGAVTEENVAGVLQRAEHDASTPVALRAVPRHQAAIADAASDLVIGEVSWYWESRETDWRRIGVVVSDEAFWGRGVGTVALGLWTDYLFATTDALRLDLATYSGNPAMVRAAIKAGYTEEARMRRARRWSGGVHDAIVLGVLREERPPRTTDMSASGFDVLREERPPRTADEPASGFDLRWDA